MDEEKKAAKINKALGVFILFFGMVIMVAIFFTDTPIGKRTNFIAGIILCSIAIGLILKARKVITSQDQKNHDNESL